jgi:hypothetical protein
MSIPEPPAPAVGPSPSGLAGKEKKHRHSGPRLQGRRMGRKYERRLMDEFIGDLRSHHGRGSPRKETEASFEDLVRYFAKRLALIRGAT